jgi:hypothetical protein
VTVAVAAVDEQRPARLVMVLILSVISVSMSSVLNVLTTILDPVRPVSALQAAILLLELALVLVMKTLDVLMKMSYVNHATLTVAHVQPVRLVTLLPVLLVRQVLGTQVQTPIHSVLVTVQLDSHRVPPLLAQDLVHLVIS